MPSKIKNSVAVVLAAFLLQGCIIKVSADVGSDISRVFGSVSVGEGDQVGDIDSVNGSITLDDASSAESVETVNGSIRAGRDVSADSLETVNGRIEADRRLTVDGSVATVNGRIELREDSTVGRDVETVNGKIELEGVRVGGSVETVNGDMYIVDGTVVEKDIVFNDNNGWGGRKGDEPRLYIDGESEVMGDIILYRPVILEIEDGAKIGDIDRRYNEDRYMSDRR